MIDVRSVVEWSKPTGSLGEKDITLFYIQNDKPADSLRLFVDEVKMGHSDIIFKRTDESRLSFPFDCLEIVVEHKIDKSPFYYFQKPGWETRLVLPSMN